ncbi:ATP synthase F0F1 subunit B [Neosynechococcus sphagnicola sy1]|uniref:ATP synthase subunit b n=1 Tax=Neosynechococcus sphagnicola sy1 TaxID=1497020 RepID=A0A098TNP0_9CYAN|nr:F0F1 ATP synthase subunit B [Neosynechococcus sphagnicola]KGF73950.1 ATP synthase F0F1 subunit B [Neosynechococcus sphagnicola sy1]
MGSFLWLATEPSAAASQLAEAVEAHGIGLNFNLLETNLINLAIVIAVLFYFGRQFLGKVLTERREAIAVAIQEAEAKRQQAAIALAEEQQKLTQAQAEVEKIRASATETAKAARAAILAKAADDVKRMQENAVQDLTSAQERVMGELRQRIATLALTQVESQLKSQLDAAKQQQLIDRSIALLGGSR